MAQTDAKLVSFIRDATDILIFTGAGISTASGIPDYRGPQGVWKNRLPVYYQDFISSQEARNAYWEYKLEGWQTFRNAKPNAVHQAIARLEQAGKILLVVTQNIDGLHALAGTSRDKLVELHGSNLFIECLDCGERSDPEKHFAEFERTRQAPLCPKCGGFLKPATIMFGQNLIQEDLQRAMEATERADLVIALGSTLSVQPAATIPLMAAQRGVPYVIINRGATDHDDMSSVSLRLEGDVIELFPPAVTRALKPTKR